MEEDLPDFGFTFSVESILQKTATEVVKETIEEERKALPAAVRDLPQRSDRGEVGDRFGLAEQLVTDELVEISSRAIDGMAWEDVLKLDERVNLSVQEIAWEVDETLKQWMAQKRKDVREFEKHAIDVKYATRDMDKLLSSVLAELEDAIMSVQLTEHQARAATQDIAAVKATQTRVDQQVTQAVALKEDELAALMLHFSIEKNREQELWQKLVEATETNTSMLNALQQKLLDQRALHARQLTEAQYVSRSRLHTLKRHQAEEIYLLQLTCEQKVKLALIGAKKKIESSKERLQLNSEELNLISMEREMDEEEAEIIQTELDSRLEQLANVSAHTQQEMADMQSALTNVRASLVNEIEILREMAKANHNLEQNVSDLRVLIHEKSVELEEKQKILDERADFLLHHDTRVIDNHTRDLQDELDHYRGLLRDSQASLQHKLIKLENFERQSVGWKKMIIFRSDEIRTLEKKVQSLNALINRRTDEINQLRSESNLSRTNQHDGILREMQTKAEEIQKTTKQAWDEMSALQNHLDREESDFQLVVQECVGMLKDSQLGDIDVMIREHRANVLRFESMGAECEARGRQVQNLREDRREFSQQIHQLLEEIRTITTTYRDVTQQLAHVDYDNKKNVITGQLSEFEKNHGVTPAESDLQVKKLIAAEAKKTNEISQLVAKIATVAPELDRLAAQTEQKIAGTAQKEHEIELLEKSLEPLGKMAQALTDQLKVKFDSAKELKASVQELEAKEVNEKRWVELGEKELKEWQEDVTIQKDSFLAWKSRYDGAEAILEDHQIRMANALREKEELIKQIQSVESEIEKARQHVEDRKNLLVELQDQHSKIAAVSLA